MARSLTKCYVRKGSCRVLRKQVEGKARFPCQTKDGLRGGLVSGARYPKRNCSADKLQSVFRRYQARKSATNAVAAGPRRSARIAAR